MCLLLHPELSDVHLKTLIQTPIREQQGPLKNIVVICHVQNQTLEKRPSKHPIAALLCGTDTPKTKGDEAI